MDEAEKIKRREKLIYLVPFKKHIPSMLLVDIPGFETLSSEIKWLGFLDAKINLGILDMKLF